MTALTQCQLGWGGNDGICQLPCSCCSEPGVALPHGLGKMWRGNQDREVKAGLSSWAKLLFSYA